jgi:hypothetical protein
METGALVCTARSPRGDECPLRKGCSARVVATSSGRPRAQRWSPAYRYEGSKVCYRGRVLAELRKISRVGGEGIPLRDLGRRVRQDFDEGDPYWLLAAVESLCKDGLAKIEMGPEAADVSGTVAEERVTCGAGAQQSDSLSLDRAVSLP